MSKPILLLTGATGLVGRFILRRLLQADWDVCVVVRPGITNPTAGDSDRHRLARRRIEQVLQPFEQDSLLPRPKVIAWDFASDQGGPALSDIAWLKRQPVVVVHCAASIKFVCDRQSGEPYHTNVTGVQNLLQHLKMLNVVAFHHVSTAYVGQHRQSRVILEQPVPRDHLGGNDYERSKIQAEQLILEADCLGQVFIHRPSIVVGDSQTGFSSTFHGFYAPLQIGWQYAQLFGFSQQAGEWFRQQLGLNPSDSKNLVTVDWVAEGIFRAVQRQYTTPTPTPSAPEVYHWTNPRPVPCEVMQAAIVDAIKRSHSATGKRSTNLPGRVESTAHDAAMPPDAQRFREQMTTYESYFQSDPQFDRHAANQLDQALACPSVDYELLTKLSDWAISANFGWPRPPLPPLENEAIVSQLARFDWLSEGEADKIVRVQLLGPGAPESLYLARRDNRWYGTAPTDQIDTTWRVSLQALSGCIFRTIELIDLIESGNWLIMGKSADQDLANAANWINYIRASID